MTGGVRISRAAVLVEPGRIEVRARPVPAPGPGQVLLRVRYAGICATDLAIVRGTYPVELPLVPGHEFCAEVEAVGEEVPERWVGAWVASEINASCRQLREPEPCAACRREMPGHCLKRVCLGIRGADGAFADHVVVPAACVHALPDTISPWTGVFVEPLAAALQVFELTPVSPGDVVVVLGTGRLGLLACRVAHSYGARVFAISRSERNRMLALRLGADEAIDPAVAEEMGWIRDATGGLGADLVVECTGSPAGLGRAVELARPRGTVALKTTCGLPAEDFSATEVVVREIRIQGSRCGPFGKAIERLAAGQIPVDDLVSGVYPLEDIGAALAAADRALKILIEVNP